MRWNGETNAYFERKPLILKGFAVVPASGTFNISMAHFDLNSVFFPFMLANAKRKC